MKSVIVGIAILLSFVPGAQEYRVGDSLKTLRIENVLNFKSTDINIEDFSDKLVILDFWGFNCTSCLEGFPLLDSLQKNFGDKLQIFLVNKEDKQDTKEFFEKRKKLFKPDLPFITSDTILHKMFRHNSVPANVWIGKMGKVLYMADGYFTTGSNVGKVITGEDIKLPQQMARSYVETFFDPKYEYLLENYSFISKCEDLTNLETSAERKGFPILTYNCKSAVQLYQAAFKGIIGNKIDFSKPGRTIIVNYDSLYYTIPEDDQKQSEWLNNYTYSYQSVCKTCTNRGRYLKMIADLDAYFGLKAKMENRKVDGWALVNTGDLSVLKTKGGPPRYTFFKTDLRSSGQDSLRVLINQPYQRLSDDLKIYLEYYAPFRDEIKFTGNIDFKLPASVLDNLTITELKKELRKYNLDLIKKKLNLDVLVISKE